MPHIPKYPNIDDHKQCIKCDQLKTIAQYSKCSKMKSGIDSVCKDCRTEYRTKRRRAEGMKPRSWTAYPVIDGIKKCYKCLNDFPIDQFNSKGPYLRHCCRQCDIGTDDERRAKYEIRYAKEKEIRSERIKQRRKDPMYADKFKEWCKKSNHKVHSSGKYAEWYRKHSAELTDTYLMSIINRSLKGKGQYINKDMVEPEMFEILRKNLTIKRELKQLSKNL